MLSDTKNGNKFLTFDSVTGGITVHAKLTIDQDSVDSGRFPREEIGNYTYNNDVVLDQNRFLKVQ